MGWNPGEDELRGSGFGVNRKALPCANPGAAGSGHINSKELGVKFDAEKNRMDLLDSFALGELARVLTFGATKYGDQNWRGGIKFSRLVGAALRHVYAWLGGENLDPESGINHLAHAMCNIMFLLYMTKERPDLDDRYKKGVSSGPDARVPGV